MPQLLLNVLLRMNLRSKRLTPLGWMVKTGSILFSLSRDCRGPILANQKTERWSIGPWEVPTLQ